MRKLILSALLVASTSSLFAQKIEDINKQIGNNKFADAKVKVDAALNDPKNQSNSDFWFAKAQVYNNLAKEKQDSALQTEALTAMQKYFELEAGKEQSKKALKSMLENHKTAVDIYTNFRNAGAKNFESKEWASAYHNFNGALSAFDILAKNQVVPNSLDTTMVLYAGAAAQSAGLNDQAAKHFAHLADNKIADTSYLGVYTFLVNHYQQKKDKANAQKYIDLGKSLFPNNPSWVAFELQGIDGEDKAGKLARLEQLVQQNPTNDMLTSEYVVELYNYNYGGEKRPADYAKRQEDLTNALKKSVELSPSEPYNFYIFALHTERQIEELKQSKNAIKGTTPADAKKRVEMNKAIDAKHDEQAKYAQAAFDIYDKKGTALKGNEKSNFKTVANMLYDYYTMKKDAEKAKFYDDKISTIK